MRDKANREVKLGSYELFQRSGPQAAVWDKMMRGLSTRNYGPVVKDFANAYGVEKSTVSENFIEASREKLKELMERRLEEKSVRGADRWDSVQGSADDRGAGHRLRRHENRVGIA